MTTENVNENSSHSVIEHYTPGDQKEPDEDFECLDNVQVTQLTNAWVSPPTSLRLYCLSWALSRFSHGEFSKYVTLVYVHLMEIVLRILQKIINVFSFVGLFPNNLKQFDCSSQAVFVIEVFARICQNLDFSSLYVPMVFIYIFLSSVIVHLLCSASDRKYLNQDSPYIFLIPLRSQKWSFRFVSCSDFSDSIFIMIQMYSTDWNDKKKWWLLSISPRPANNFVCSCRDQVLFLYWDGKVLQNSKGCECDENTTVK